MEETQHISEIILDIEREMVIMWLMGDTTHIMEHDPEYIAIIMTAMFYEMEHFKALGMEIGEA